ACSGWCDTDFVGTDGPGGGRFPTARALAVAARRTWAGSLGGPPPLVVCTGGEPLLQLDAPLIDALHTAGFAVAVETNGARPVPAGVDWVCVSPKGGAELLVTSGHELKLVYPQAGMPPDRFEDLDFEHFFLQPLDGPATAENLASCLRYCRAHPRWRL